MKNRDKNLHQFILKLYKKVSMWWGGLRFTAAMYIIFLYQASNIVSLYFENLITQITKIKFEEKIRLLNNSLQQYFTF